MLARARRPRRRPTYGAEVERRSRSVGRSSETRGKDELRAKRRACRRPFKLNRIFRIESSFRHLATLYGAAAPTATSYPTVASSGRSAAAPPNIGPNRERGQGRRPNEQEATAASGSLSARLVPPSSLHPTENVYLPAAPSRPIRPSRITFVNLTFPLHFCHHAPYYLKK